MDIKEYLKKDLIFIVDEIEDTDTLYEKFAEHLNKKGIITNSKEVKRLFIKRESVQSTAIGKGAAVPHIFSDEFKEFFITIALIKNGVDFKAPDEELVFVVFLIMSDQRYVGLHLKSLAHIARLIKSTNIIEEIKKSNSTDEIYNIVLEKEKSI